MKNKLASLWALATAGNRRQPTTTELAVGFPCGVLTRNFFNELFLRALSAEQELVNFIVASGSPC